VPVGADLNEDAKPMTNRPHESHERGALLRDWHLSLVILHRGHWSAARHYESRNFWLGLLAAVSAAIAGTAVFATLSESPSTAVRTAIGGFSILAAVLSALQTYFRSSELAERHKGAAVKYGFLRRELEQRIQSDEGASSEAKLDDFRGRWDAIDGESPPIPAKLYAKAVGSAKRTEPGAARKGPGAL
jgi:hypothetical protein